MAFARDQYVEAAKDTRQASRNFWLNTAFLAGLQWIFWDNQRDIPRERPGDSRHRFVDNRMATNHRTLIANLLQRELAFDVKPNGADDASIQASYIATEVLYHLHQDHNWEKLREQVVISILKGGTGAIALDWDEERNDSVESVLSIAEFVVEPGARDPERARWWVKAQLLSPGEVQDMYELSEPPPADAAQGLNPLAETILASHLGTDHVNPLTLVLTYYERPTKTNKKGKFCVEINNEIVQQGDWPFPFTDRLNLVCGVETSIENKWYGDTIYSQARGPQVALNKAQSNLSEHLDDVSTTRMLVPHSAVKLMEVFNDVPGNMYPYPDGLRGPEYMPPPQLPQWLQGLPDGYKRAIDDIMGVHDVSRGQAPANLESGTAISILAEMDGSPVGRLIKEAGGMFGRLSSLVLELHQAESKGKRIAVIEGEAGPLSIEWTGSDIAGQTFARVPLEAIMPRSKAAQTQIAQEMLKMGLLKTVEDYAQFAEMPNARDIVQVMAPNKAKARREHSLMARGETVTPALFDRHADHIIEHNNFRLTVAYERLSRADQEKVDLHLQAHETLAAEAMAKMASRAAADPALGAVPSANDDPSAPPPLPPAPGGAPAPELPAGPPPDTVEPDPAAAMNELIGEL